MECSSVEQKTFGEKHGPSEPMDMGNRSVGSNAQENFLITECSSPKHDTLGEKDELGYENLQSEPMEPRSIVSDAPGTSKLMESSGLKQIRLVEEHEIGSEHVSSEPMEAMIVGSDALENCLPAECSNSLENSIPENNYLGETQVTGAEHVISRKNSLCANHEQVTENFGLKPYSLGKEHTLVSENKMNETTDSGDVRLDVWETCQTEECLSSKQSKLAEKHELGFNNLQSEPMDSAIIGSDAQEKCQVTESSSLKRIKLVEENVSTENVEGEAMEPKVVGSDSINVELMPDVGVAKNSTWSAHKEKSASSLSRKRKYVLRSSASSTRILRSRLRSTSKAPYSSTVTANVSDVKKKKTKGRKKKALNDEYSRIRKRIRYLLNRMGYEHSLIDAYSGEGWKGQSIEKLKPEKELQRATSEILRCKKRIRDLFQHLDSLCAEGRLQESLFDSEGQINSEDIFCAKCGSKDLTVENDIILCDGTCDRGFHQMCLEPPLLKEEIPLGDEGWLCPGCDCKVDCIDLLNDFQGTDLSVDDNWEKVFPEAAATADVNRLDENFEFPSDDSDDNDYDPDGLEIDGKIETESSTSEESDFTSASDELMTLPQDEQYLGLPSDDSEDDVYDPNAPDIDENVNKESSSSDFTSDPENFSASSCDNGTSGGDEVPVSSSINGGKLASSLGQMRTKTARNKKQFLNAELLSLQEPQLQGPSSPVSRKRQIERLDYKKLHDETYGNATSDSSDDEDWADVETQKRKKNDETKKESGKSPKGTPLTARRKAVTIGREQNSKRTNNISKRRTRQKLEFDGANSLATETPKHGSISDSIGKKPTASSSRRLGNTVTERLLESLKENEYPSRDKKETLAKELGITPKQVSKWFENARWSLRHPANDNASSVANTSPRKETAPSRQSTSTKKRNTRSHTLDDQSKTNMETPTVKNTETEETSADVPKSQAGKTRSKNKSREATKSTIQTRQRRKALS